MSDRLDRFPAVCTNDEARSYFREKGLSYRVITEEYKAVAVGTGDTVVQEFYPCIGEKCAGYHMGTCLRLNEALHSCEVNGV